MIRIISVELVKLLPVHRYSVDIFHVLILQEYWVLMESKITLKPLLGSVRIVALSIYSYEQTHLNRVYCFLIL